MLQIDMFGEPARSTTQAPPTASPKQRAAKAPRSSLLSKRDLHRFSELTAALSDADRRQIEAYADAQVDRARAMVEGRGATPAALVEQAERFAMGAVAAASSLLRWAYELRAEAAAEPAPESSVKPKSEPPPAPKKRRGRPPTIRTEEHPTRNAREDRPPTPNDKTAAAVPPPKMVLTPEKVLGMRPAKPPARRPQVAP